jgi:LemA protein
MMLSAVLVFLALIATWGVVIFNRLVRDRNRVASAWSDIDVQLLRRHDLIPKLVDAVKAYAAYERSTLEAVTELRSQSLQASRLGDRARLEKQIEGGVHRLLALAESYPDLKANRNFLDLQQQLTEVEDYLQYARRFYNGAVRIFNTRIESFPQSLVARTLGFQQAEFFDAGEDTVRARPSVELD